jgi:radical SAM superfamily enzyme YgiQ (UPF0313 family)
MESNKRLIQLCVLEMQRRGIYESDVYKDFRNLVNDYAPNLIALSTVEPTHEFGIELLSFVRDRKIPTIVGGVHTIFSPEEVLQANSVDMVCIGEGEKCLVELCEKMAKGEPYHNIDNIWTKTDTGIIKNTTLRIDELNNDTICHGRYHNKITQSLILDKYGADALRYYLLASPLVKAEDLCFLEAGVD